MIKRIFRVLGGYSLMDILYDCASFLVVSSERLPIKPYRGLKINYNKLRLVLEVKLLSWVHELDSFSALTDSLPIWGPPPMEDHARAMMNSPNILRTREVCQVAKKGWY